MLKTIAVISATIIALGTTVGLTASKMSDKDRKISELENEKAESAKRADKIYEALVGMHTEYLNSVGHDKDAEKRCKELEKEYKKIVDDYKANLK